MQFFSEKFPCGIEGIWQDIFFSKLLQLHDKLGGIYNRALPGASRPLRIRDHAPALSAYGDGLPQLADIGYGSIFECIDILNVCVKVSYFL